MSRGSLAAVVAVVALVVPPLAGASSVERVRVAGPGVTAAFPHGLSLELASPPDYRRQSVSGLHGRWTGPDYWPSGKPDQHARANIDWSVAFQARPGTAKSVALASPTHGWPLEKKDPIAVPHYVGKRVVGTILGFYALTRAPAPDDASFEAALAFPVAPRAFSIVRFVLADPGADSAGAFGDYLVNGLDPPSVWNRGQAFWAMSGVRVIGNLPPAAVDVRATGRRLRGTVTDAFHHPVLGLPVSIQHQSGTSWRVTASARTNVRGQFSVRVAARGPYRVVVGARAKRIVSRALYVG